MDVMTLEVQPRDKSMKAKELLANNLLPLEYYGKGVENSSFQVDYQTFRRLYKVAGGNTVIELNDGKKKMNVLVHKVDTHPVTDKMTHVDLINVKMNVVIHAHIPLNFVGTAPAVKDLAGTLTHNLEEIEVKCLPGDLVHEIDVNIESIVDFHSSIHVSDLEIPSTLELVTPADEVVVSAVPPREEKEEEEVAEAAEGEAAEAGGGEESAGEEAGE